MGLVHCSICPPYVEMKKLWNTSLVPIQWAKPHDATKMPQLLCVKLEDPKNFTSQALRRSRAVIHLVLPALPCGEQSKHHVTRTNEARPRDWWAERAFAPGTNPTLACALGRPRRPRFTLWAAGDGVAWLGAAIDSRRVSPPARFSLAVNAERHAIQ